MILVVMTVFMLATVILFIIVFVPTVFMLIFAEIKTPLCEAGMEGELLHARSHACTLAHTRALAPARSSE